jgi:hypothetical protein
METIPYRNTKLFIKTIPKDTLLFRLVNNPEDDLKGVLLKDGKRCITPNYNVFFYPNPFAGILAFQKYINEFTSGLIHVYKLKYDVKVLSLLKPSEYTRTSKNLQRTFIKRCSTVKKGCLPRQGKSYDPCLSDTIIKKYPEIVGMIAIQSKDSNIIKKNLKKTQKLQKYFKFAEDATSNGIPELILHPLRTRSTKNILTTNEPLDTNYEHFKEFNIKDIQKLEEFMKSTTYDPETYFYKFKNGIV